MIFFLRHQRTSICMEVVIKSGITDLNVKLRLGEKNKYNIFVKYFSWNFKTITEYTRCLILSLPHITTNHSLPRARVAYIYIYMIYTDISNFYPLFEKRKCVFVILQQQSE